MFKKILFLCLITTQIFAAEPLKPSKVRRNCRRGLFVLLVGGGAFGLSEGTKTSRKIAKDTFKSKLGNGDVHLVFVGDSLGTSFSRGSFGRSLYDLRMRPKKNNWLIGGDEVNGFFERTQFPLKITNLAVPTAGVDGEHLYTHNEVEQAVGRIRNFSDQVEDLLSLDFNIALLAMGSNNVDWLAAAEEYEGLKNYKDHDYPEDIAKKFRDLSAESFSQQYKNKVDLIIKKASTSSYPVAIGIYSLPSFERILEGTKTRQTVRGEALEKAKFFSSFPSFLPRHEKVSLEFRNQLNDRLTKLVAEKNIELIEKGMTHIHLFTVPTYALFDASDVTKLSEADGVHPSAKGHDWLAEQAVKDLQPLVTFVGVPAQK